MRDITTQPQDLDAQIAQRLFGWEPNLYGVWGKPLGANRYAIEAHLPAYTTDPAATALVWQWLEAHGPLLHGVHVTYTYDGEEGPYLRCMIVYGRQDCSGTGATWPEALCRAALALAEALKQGEEG